MGTQGAIFSSGERMAKIVLIFSVLAFGEMNIPGLLEVPSNNGHGNTMAILYTGDGGWRTTDRGVAGALAKNGIPVAGVNTLRYFWNRRTPEEAADDFARVLAHYISKWKKDRVVVIGYSYGADVLPFILNRIPKPLLAKIRMLVLLAPTERVEFEFHVRQWFSTPNPSESRPVLPELEKLGDPGILAFCGDRDGESLCRDLPPRATKIMLHGAGHRFDSYCKPISQKILKELRK